METQAVQTQKEYIEFTKLNFFKELPGDFKLDEKNNIVQYKGDTYNLNHVKIDLNYAQNVEYLKEAKVFTIRHALSEFNFVNRLTHWSNQFNSLPENVRDQIQLDQKYDPIFIDTPLHKIGEMQAQSQVETIKQLKFQIVFISPLKRVLQTMKILFENHPQKSEIKFVVIPEISESMGWSTSITTESYENVQEYIKKYGFNIDFSLLEKAHENKLLWPYVQLVNPQKKEHLINLLADPSLSKQDVADKLIDYFKQISPKKVETNEEIFQRAQNGKKTIIQYLKDNKITLSSENKIAIISHAVLMQNFTASQFNYQKDKPLDGLRHRNVELNPYDLQLN